MKITILFFTLLGLSGYAQDLNVARPDRDVYADPARNRNHHRFSDATVNEARLYDFYQRQADHVMKQAARPTLLPAYPGLDAGMHGHWGKHNQNSYAEPRVNDMDFGRLHFQMIGDRKLAKARQVAFVSLGTQPTLHSLFDPGTLTFPLAWTGDFITVDPFRYGASRGAKPAGSLRWHERESGWTDAYGDRLTGQLRGWYRHGRYTVFASDIDGCTVYDLADAHGELLIRHLANLGDEARELTLWTLPTAAAYIAHTKPMAASLLYGAGSTQWWAGSPQAGALRTESRRVVATVPARGTLRLAVWQGGDTLPTTDIAHFATAPAIDPQTLLAGGEKNWPEVHSGPPSTGPGLGAIAIDDLYTPTNNPARSLLLMTGIDFTPEGDAIICTLPGEVWRVSGLADPAGDLHWRKIASGINQPFGLRVRDSTIYIMARTQVLALHDRNFDREIDYHEVIANDFDERSGGIAMHFGLELAENGDLYFIANTDLCRWSATTRRTEIVARGFRNGMGLGMLPGDRVLVAPQEGEWTPASMIIEAARGEHFGFSGFGNKDGQSGLRIDAPLCYVPRGLDNSTGGMTYIDRGSWGPLEGAIYAYSYGAGSHYYVLQDSSGPRPQGAAVPLPGDFPSGVVRGRFNPADDHIYLVGTQGWGNYASQFGSFHRVRYTGNPLRQPTGFQAYANGLRVQFEDVLDPFEAEKVGNYLAQQWNYEYANRYGSPEFSVRQPNQLGHDVLTILSARVLEDGKSLFLEIPELQPVNQLYLRMHLRTVTGESFKADLFPTIKYLGQPFAADGLAPLVTGKTESMPIRVRRDAPKPKKDKAAARADRKIVLKAIAGLRYDQTEIRAVAGEQLEITLRNDDVAMQHNWVLVQPGAFTEVGEASFKMLSDPAAAEKNYVPDLPAVIADIPLVDPGESITRVIQVPRKTGRYPFLCTFPGHWQAMKGVLVVKNK